VSGHLLKLFQPHLADFPGFIGMYAHGGKDGGGKFFRKLKRSAAAFDCRADGDDAVDSGSASAPDHILKIVLKIFKIQVGVGVGEHVESLTFQRLSQRGI
jgi:hypothetical protein